MVQLSMPYSAAKYVHCVGMRRTLLGIHQAPQGLHMWYSLPPPCLISHVGLGMQLIVDSILHNGEVDAVSVLQVLLDAFGKEGKRIARQVRRER